MYNNKAACACSKHDDHDDDKMNTLAFVNFLLVKIFPILICQNFPNPNSSKNFHHQNFAPYGITNLCDIT